MENPPPVPQKNGLGPLAWVGIGCGSLVLIGVIAVVIVGLYFGPKAKKFAEEMAKNPTRGTATTMVTASMGTLELVAEDDANKRYTVREKKSGKLTTIYWDEKKNAPEVVEGDFSAIPQSGSAPAETRPLPQPK